MPSKKKLKKELNRMMVELSEQSQSRDRWKQAAEAAKSDLDMWRKKYELSQLTPEVKADTEAAFKRGSNFAKTTMLNNIREMITHIAEAPNA
jgi:hypothetical protein